MKKKRPITSSSEKTGVTKKGRVTEVWYSKEVKLAKNYNSAGATLGMKASVAKGESIKATTLDLKKLVRASMNAEIPKIVEFLDKAAD